MRRAWAAFVLALALAAAPARAATCTFMSVSAPALGSYDVFSPTSTDSAGNIAYTCTGGATVTIALSMGNGPTFSPRHLQRMGGFLMSYNLYLDGGHSMIWGDGTGTSVMSPPSAPADGAVVMVPIFASIPAHQDVGLGSYTDSIMVTLNF
ncbi:MAG TPA: spore coat U domain-containing protein [Polyangia bacterium]|jgi:spore coat protein U-like protein|nr:spore coat U domain-containing protein [Polyangia bacterium]